MNRTSTRPLPVTGAILQRTARGLSAIGGSLALAKCLCQDTWSMSRVTSAKRFPRHPHPPLFQSPLPYTCSGTQARRSRWQATLLTGMITLTTGSLTSNMHLIVVFGPPGQSYPELGGLWWAGVDVAAVFPSRFWVSSLCCLKIGCICLACSVRSI
ncbi:hypothetical protein B0I35DRAFT_129666 [Stachybotrys elegans]|uniref:Uncharacterized protein n=1 Tax=Stachybotrys elegans TaxID=80388 RepID=A0A8K0SYU4_9HYPO|nr:hypothetical protein B0I35DRAFT_129666 [Stachybotrys elegans]